MNVDHLNMMLRYKEAKKKYHLVSATQQKLFNELEKLGFMFLDENELMSLTLYGESILEATVNEFIRLTEIFRHTK